MRSPKAVLAISLAAITMLAAVGLVSTGAWLISAAALMPPLLTLQVAIVSVRAFGISRGVFRYAERVVSHDVALTGTTAQRVKLWEAAAALGPRGVWRLRGSDALDRLTSDTDILQDEVTRVRTPFLAALAAAFILVFIQISLLPVAGFALLLAFLISGIGVPLLTYRIEKRISLEAISIRNRISAITTDAVENGDEIRVLGLEADLSGKLALAEAQRIAVESRASRWAGFASAINGVSAGFAVFCGIYGAINAHTDGAINGTTIAVIALLPWATSEIIATFSIATTAHTRASAARERVDSLLLDADKVISGYTTIREKFLASPSVLDVEDLGVTWTTQQVVSHVTFSVQRGHRLAIVGPSGSGKSSLAAAILRLVEHTGTVALDNIPVERLTDFRQHVTALLQSTHVFHTTVAENLRIADPLANETLLREVLLKAGLGPWLETLPEELNTMIGDGGRGMSGGEIQRLGIARALLSDASFVVLDEPTEHLDTETAARIWTTINDNFKDRGLIIITHDSKVAALADEILVLDQGHVVEHVARGSAAQAGWLDTWLSQTS
ncbi:MAG: putative cysteine transporter ATP-binding and permease protein [Actinomycetota bacterium]